MDNEWNISQEQAKMLLQIIVVLMLGTPEEAEKILKLLLEGENNERL